MTSVEQAIQEIVEERTMNTEVVAAQRPGLVLGFSIFFTLWPGWTLLSLLLVSTGVVPLTPAQVAYFDSLSPLDYVLSVSIGLTSIGGAITLFLLRRVAFHLFAAALGAKLLLTCWRVAADGFVGALGNAALFGAVIGLGLLFAVVAYSRRLLQHGVLR
jgi:hypothetical protein